MFLQVPFTETGKYFLLEFSTYNKLSSFVISPSKHRQRILNELSFKQNERVDKQMPLDASESIRHRNAQNLHKLPLVLFVSVLVRCTLSL